MAGFRIFMHSIRMVFGNLGPAIQIFGILYIPLAALYFIPPLEDGAGGGASLSYLALALLAVLVSCLLFSWMAVAWHRYILLGERSTAFLPPLRRARWMVYLRRLFFLALIMLLIGLGGGLILGFTGFLFHTPIMAMIGGAILLLVFSVVFYRLALVLPAAAVDRYPSFGEAWKATRGAKWTIVVLAILSAVALTVLDAVGTLFAAAPALAAVWLVITGWLNTVVSVTILTTIYGHYVEGRPIG